MALNQIKIGTPELPFPSMTGAQLTDDGKVVESTFAAITDPFLLYTDVATDVVLGELFRNLPVPSLLAQTLQFIRLWMANERRIIYYEGEPGVGKSHAGLLLGRVLHSKGSLVFNCQGRDVNDGFAQTVINQDALRPISDKIDIRINEHNSGQRPLGPMSLAMLRAFGDACKEDGKLSIDWDEYAGKNILASKPSEEEKEHGISPLLNARLKKIQDFCTVEGIPFGAQAAGGGALGLKVIPGPIYQGFLEDRPVLCDEITRAKPGTPDTLLEIAQLLINERASFTATIGDQIITCDKAKMGKRFGLILTGNDPNKDIGANPLSDALLDRTGRIQVNKPTRYDLKHYWSTLITGVPVATLYEVYGNMAKANPEAFGEFLVSLRTYGLSKEKIAQIPSWQFDQLANWKNVVEASKQLANFMTIATDIGNPESMLHMNSSNKALSDVANEIQGQDIRNFNMGMRFARRILQEAIASQNKIVLPASLPNSINLGQAAANSAASSAPTGFNVAEHMGTGIVAALIDAIANTSGPNLPKLCGQWLETAKQNGIYTLPDSTAPDPNSIIALLNCSPAEQVKITADTQPIQQAMCALLRSLYPQEKLSPKDDDLLPLPRVQKALNRSREPGADNSKPRSFIVPNLAGGLVEACKVPLSSFDILDSIETADDSKKDDETANPVLAVADQVIAGITLLSPLVQHNWRQLLRHDPNAGQTANSNETLFLEKTGILTGKSANGLAFTTVAAVASLAGTQSFPLHIMAVNKPDAKAPAKAPEFLIVGPKEVGDALPQNSPVTYVSYDSGKTDAAQKKIISWLESKGGFTESSFKEIVRPLTNAFFERNQGMEMEVMPKTIQDYVQQTLLNPKQKTDKGNIYVRNTHLDVPAA